jgi:CBS domain-containing protein
MQTLSEVMSRDVHVISPDATLQEAAQQMRDGGFGLMPVGENDRMIGTISDRDIAVRAIADGKPATTKVREAMSNGVIWAYENASLEEAASKMCEHQIRRLPVVNADKRLVGIVALGDFAVEGEDIAEVGRTLSEISEPA